MPTLLCQVEGVANDKGSWALELDQGLAQGLFCRNQLGGLGFSIFKMLSGLPVFQTLNPKATLKNDPTLALQCCLQGCS